MDSFKDIISLGKCKRVGENLVYMYEYMNTIKKQSDSMQVFFPNSFLTHCKTNTDADTCNTWNMHKACVWCAGANFIPQSNISLAPSVTENLSALYNNSSSQLFNDDVD